MCPRSLRLPSFVVAAVLSAALPVFAQSQARLQGTVIDEAGNPVAGVKVTITTEALATYHQEAETNAKGAFNVALLDATKVYRYKFEKAGFAPYEEEIKIGIGQNERRTFKLLSVAAAAAQGLGGVDPAVEAFNAGAEAFNQGDTSTAITKMEEALQLNPQLVAAHAGLAQIHLQAGRAAEAAGAAERAVAIDPAHVMALKIAIEAYGQLGDSAKAGVAAAALAAADPAAASGTSFNRGVELYNGGQTAEAIPEFESALTADPANAKAHYMLGLCYSGTGDTAKAKLHLEKFLELAPGDADAELAKEMLKYL